MNIPGGRTDADLAVAEIASESYGKLVAFLASICGDISSAEDALSDAFVAALRTWSSQGVPDRPTTWLLTAARRNLIGAARRRDVARRAIPALARAAALVDDTLERSAPASIPDRRLELLFVCAHPSIDESIRAPLMLQTVFGLDAVRIATAFLLRPATVGQRLVRAKARIRDAKVPFEVPAAAELPGRLGAVLDAVYAAFGTGWDAPAGHDYKRTGLADEAIRLAVLLAALLPTEPEAHGLAALLLHCHARRDARRSVDGAFVPLREQRVDAWSRDDMQAAERHLSTALGLGRIGPYQLMAAIQSLHNRRALGGSQNLDAIAKLYDGLVQYTPSIGARVARAAARAEVDGPAAGLLLLDEIDRDLVEQHQPFHATRAHLLASAGDHAGAHAAAVVAIDLTDDAAVRSHLIRTFGSEPGGFSGPERRSEIRSPTMS